MENHEFLVDFYCKYMYNKHMERRVLKFSF